MNGADVLGGVFFDIAGSPTLSDGNAALTGGSTYEQRDGVSSSGNDLNDEWMFDSPVNTLGRMYGIGATGYPEFNPLQDPFTDRFNSGSVTAGANSDYGLIPSDGIKAGNFTNVYTKNSATFTFMLSSAVSESDISNVMVTYGSNGETTLVPEPASLGALGLGVLALLRRRSKT